MRKPIYHSHRNDEMSGGTAPTQAHMALQTRAIGEPDALLPIPIGSHLFFISDPRRADGVTEMILEKVVFENGALKEVRLVAFTRSTKSTRRLSLKANWAGEYKSGLENDQSKLGEVLDKKLLPEGKK
jgi:hypothetical protein